MKCLICFDKKDRTQIQGNVVVDAFGFHAILLQHGEPPTHSSRCDRILLTDCSIDRQETYRIRSPPFYEWRSLRLAKLTRRAIRGESEEGRAKSRHH